MLFRNEVVFDDFPCLLKCIKILRLSRASGNLLITSHYQFHCPSVNVAGNASRCICVSTFMSVLFML